MRGPRSRHTRGGSGEPPPGSSRRAGGRRGLLSLPAALVSALTALALAVTLAPPAAAADKVEQQHSWSIGGAELELRTSATQDATYRGDCYVRVSQSFEVDGAPRFGAGSERRLEKAIKGAVSQTRLDLRGGYYGDWTPSLQVGDQREHPSGGLAEVFPPNGYGDCPDVLENDYHRRLGAIGVLGRTIGAMVAAAVVTTVVAAGLTMLAAELFPLAYTQPAFISGIACVSNAAGTLVSVGILGGDAKTLAATALVACVSSVFSDKLQTLAAKLSERRANLRAVVTAVDQDGLELVENYSAAQMQAFLTSFGD